MQVTDILTSSGLGGVQKAFLIVHRKDAAAVNTAQVRADTVNALLGAAGKAALLEAADSLGAAGDAMASHVMQVQYNPSSLAIQANADPISFTCLQRNIDNGIPSQSPRPPTVVLSVELVFDDMIPMDAFMMDKTRLSATEALSSAAIAAQGGCSVQPQTDGLVAALLKPGTRLVTFRWADMAFTGQLVEVQADYTMFSVSGRPVRSKVRMNIAQQVESGADVQYWDRALDNAFAGGDTLSLKGASQTVGNLLNLNAY